MAGKRLSNFRLESLHSVHTVCCRTWLDGIYITYSLKGSTGRDSECKALGSGRKCEHFI